MTYLALLTNQKRMPLLPGPGRVAAATHVAVATRVVADDTRSAGDAPEGITEGAAALGDQVVGRTAGAVLTPSSLCSSDLM